jgi:hypothetical protein
MIKLHFTNINDELYQESFDDVESLKGYLSYLSDNLDEDSVFLFAFGQYMMSAPFIPYELIDRFEESTIEEVFLFECFDMIEIAELIEQAQNKITEDLARLN